MCWSKERSDSKTTPKLRAEETGTSAVPWKESEESVIFERCCWVPMSKYSILFGLTESRFRVSSSRQNQGHVIKMQELKKNQNLKRRCKVEYHRHIGEKRY